MSLGRAVLWVGLAVAPVAVEAATPAGGIALGRQLFEENWLTPAADDSPLAPAKGGDGLGPLFNGASCAECHRQGGSGGAGPNEQNVEIVSLVLPLGAPATLVRRATARAKETHPGFLDTTNVFLHRFGRDDEGLGAYDGFRRRLRAMFPEGVVSARATEQTRSDGLTYQLAQRNTPALFGAGLIDRVSPALLLQAAEAQKRSFPDAAGRPANKGVGRFGWRGHMNSLEQFVRTACAAELGLRVKEHSGRTVHDQPAWPLEAAAHERKKSPPVDMTEEQVEALIKYVRSLPEPERSVPADALVRADANRGEDLFAEIGCTVCHVPDMEPARGLYSDLLLHDMGTALADRVSAPLPPPKVFRQTGSIRAGGSTGSSSGGGGSYSGGSSQPSLRPASRVVVVPPTLNELAAATQEFRTPPLWGVADSAPYLHDGRAATLDDAIRGHAGQAHAAAARYAALSDEDRGRVLAFLGTLRGPDAVHQSDFRSSEPELPAAPQTACLGSGR